MRKLDTATSPTSTGTQIFKACAPSSLCLAAGKQTFSVNLGFSSATASAECCNTDNCNSATLPFPDPQTPNNLQCNTCDPSNSECKTQIQCYGEESNCFSSVVTTDSTTDVLGCMTPNICAAAGSLSTLPFMENVGTINSGPACCGTSLCNGPITTTATPIKTTPASPTTTVAPTTTTPAPTTTTPAPTTTTVA
ncbi:integumentary mucin C.1-like, partial [Kryptolebias marmoratus]|uniref:integumentary mucin C.1-like n=1 Tax=Kryptolebias marmoratus TaxID=37003 RepID=UPI0018ACDDA1